MAGTWMSVVEGFGGMRIKDDMLSFSPRMPKAWEGFSFKLNFRNQILKVAVAKNKYTFSLDGGDDLDILVDGKQIRVTSDEAVEV